MAVNSQDFELIRNFLDGDESAFNRLAKKYQQKIYWHAIRMTGTHDDANEILQEVLLVMYYKLNTFKFESSFYTWLYRITSTRSLNFIKKRNLKKLFSLDILRNKADETNSILADLERKEDVSIIESKLKFLPPKQREVFILRSLENLSYDEISDVTGKSAGSIKANYFHAVNKLKEMMKNEKN